MVFNLALLSDAAGSTAGGLLGMLPSILLFVALIYFMIIRPQKKRQENAKNLMTSLQVGDKIQTIGGFIGEIVETEDDEFVIQSETSTLRIKKNAVAIRLSETEVVEQSVKDDDDDDDFQIEDFEI